jgi:adenosylcobinamide-GDP ribazoletransferase
MKVVNKFRLALSYLTSFPLAHNQNEPPDFSGLTSYLPAVGLAIALALELIYAVCHLLAAPQLITGAVLTLSWLALSGGIHFDGLMDTADGIFSHRSPERMLEIMHDSRVGNFGVMVGLSVLLIKFAALASAPYRAGQFALLLIPVWSRWSETFAIAYFPYARAKGMGKIWHESSTFPKDVLLAVVIPLILTIIASFIYDWRSAVLLAAATGIIGMLVSFRLASILHGQTGDTYGTVVEVAEAGALLFAALLFPQWHS